MRRRAVQEPYSGRQWDGDFPTAQDSRQRSARSLGPTEARMREEASVRMNAERAVVL
ncbi:hypothetical protein BCV70DRAFT_8146 [Testicularia cyperi]|uniref:Uncharacterized protein n=1 Tax=Testicularia cyperi TaxID=1882483 RepID=A0A317XX97_9BASI|nr:hypothetical protein BCV70DRAFT_8146 [Testicularia cyperi]